MQILCFVKEKCLPLCVSLCYTSRLLLELELYYLETGVQGKAISEATYIFCWYCKNRGKCQRLSSQKL